MRATPKRYLVAIASPDGKSVELFPMLQWCRDNPDRAPTDLVFRGRNSRALRRAFESMGWSPAESDTEVRLTPPDSSVAVGALLKEAEEADPDERDMDADDAVFELERQLQDFIAHNLESIRVGNRRLKLYTEDGAQGIEYQTGEIGRIDVLAVNQEQEFVVFELKRGNAPDRAIGQLARYMGWVKTHLANGRPVHGVIVAREISTELRYAIAAFPNVELFEYQVNFMLNRIDQVQQLEPK